jgi:hypothetical protein
VFLRRKVDKNPHRSTPDTIRAAGQVEFPKPHHIRPRHSYRLERIIAPEAQKNQSV